MNLGIKVQRPEHKREHGTKASHPNVNTTCLLFLLVYIDGHFQSLFELVSLQSCLGSEPVGLPPPSIHFPNPEGASEERQVSAGPPPHVVMFVFAPLCVHVYTLLLHSLCLCVVACCGLSPCPQPPPPPKK